MPTLVSKIYFFLLFSILFFYIRNWTCQKMSIFQNPRKESNLIKKKYFTTVIYIYRYNCISIYTTQM